MPLRVHHLNCGTMCPFGARLVNGEGSLFEPGKMCCHCLLVEGNDGLILVETGLGTRDVEEPEHLGSRFRVLARPVLRLEETAIHQVRALGFAPRDVRHIVVTHLHLDHAGGLADFTDAQVHVHSDEWHAALAPARGKERLRYRARQFSHDVKWKLYDHAHGERWFGFESIAVLPGTGSRVLLIPLQGHSRGHAAVAVEADGGWLLHAGDAYMFAGEMDRDRPRSTPGLSLFQRLADIDHRKRVDNQVRLRELVHQHAEEVSVFCAHDAREFERLSARSRELSRVH